MVNAENERHCFLYCFDKETKILLCLENADYFPDVGCDGLDDDTFFIALRLLHDDIK